MNTIDQIQALVDATSEPRHRNTESESPNHDTATYSRSMPPYVDPPRSTSLSYFTNNNTIPMPATPSYLESPTMYRGLSPTTSLKHTEALVTLQAELDVANVECVSLRSHNTQLIERVICLEKELVSYRSQSEVYASSLRENNSLLTEKNSFLEAQLALLRHSLKQSCETISSFVEDCERRARHSIIDEETSARRWISLFQQFCSFPVVLPQPTVIGFLETHRRLSESYLTDINDMMAGFTIPPRKEHMQIQTTETATSIEEVYRAVGESLGMADELISLTKKYKTAHAYKVAYESVRQRVMMAPKASTVAYNCIQSLLDLMQAEIDTLLLELAHT